MSGKSWREQSNEAIVATFTCQCYNGRIVPSVSTIASLVFSKALPQLISDFGSKTIPS